MVVYVDEHTVTAMAWTSFYKGSLQHAKILYHEHPTVFVYKTMTRSLYVLFYLAIRQCFQMIKGRGYHRAVDCTRYITGYTKQRCHSRLKNK